MSRGIAAGSAEPDTAAGAGRGPRPRVIAGLCGLDGLGGLGRFAGLGGLRLSGLALALDGTRGGRRGAIGEGLVKGLFETRRLAGPLAQVIQLRPPHAPVALHDDVGDAGRFDGERSLDALALNDAAHDEHPLQTAAFDCDDDAREQLDALLVAFLDQVVNVDGVNDAKRGSGIIAKDLLETMLEVYGRRTV